MDESFGNLQDEARKLEKKALSYKEYDGEVHTEISVDLSPAEFIDMNYTDLLNLYERTQKILSARKMNIYGGTKAAAPTPQIAKETARSEEIQTNLEQMSTESQEMAKKIGEEMRKDEERAAEGKPESPPEVAPPPKPAEIEFESIPAEEKEKADMEELEEKKSEAPPIEEKEIHVEVPLEEEPEEEKPVEAPPATEEPKPIEKKVIVAIPPVLKQDPNEAARKRFEEIEGKVRGALGEKVSETELKKKMLELTKQLFKEKSVNRREEIKSEITILKNLLSGKAVKGTGKGKKVTGTMANAQVLDSIVKSQMSEITSTKDKITGPFRKQLESAKKNFYDSIKGADDEEKKKRYEALVFTLTSLSEQIPEIVEKYEEFLLQKHLAEIEKLRESLGKKEAKTATAAEKRIKEIKKKYPDELSSIRNIVTKEIDNVIESAGREVFVEKEEPEEVKEEKEEIAKKPAKKETTEENAQDKIFEINEIDEGTLLYFLHAKNKDY